MLWLVPSTVAPSWNVMKRHAQKHGLLTFSYHPASLIEARYHKCRLCSRDILCDKSFIGTHSYSRQDISPEQYKSGANEKQEQTTSRWGSNKVSTSEKVQEAFPHTDTILVTKRVANACIFTCPNCGKKSASSSSSANTSSAAAGEGMLSPRMSQRRGTLSVVSAPL